jgi:hypothetical protein
MTTVIATRQELYLRLFEHIWKPERLGLPAPLAPPYPQPAASVSRQSARHARALRDVNRLRVGSRTRP